MNKQLALKIFEGFSIQRWNDLIRPFDLVEMDKAAEKMVLAYIIGKYERMAFINDNYYILSDTKVDIYKYKDGILSKVKVLSID